LFGSVLVVDEEPCVQEAASSQSQLRFRRLDLARALVQSGGVAAEGCVVVQSAKTVAKLISHLGHPATLAHRLPAEAVVIEVVTRRRNLKSV